MTIVVEIILSFDRSINDAFGNITLNPWMIFISSYFIIADTHDVGKGERFRVSRQRYHAAVELLHLSLSRRGLPTFEYLTRLLFFSPSSGLSESAGDCDSLESPIECGGFWNARYGRRESTGFENVPGVSYSSLMIIFSPHKNQCYEHGNVATTPERGNSNIRSIGESM